MAEQATESKLDEEKETKNLSPLLDLLENITVDPLQIWYGTGGWLPGPIKLLLWRDELKSKLDVNEKLLPPVEALKLLIDTDASVKILANQMMQQTTAFHPRFGMTIPVFLAGINRIIQTPIKFRKKGLIGIPLAAWFSGVDATLAGQTLFRYAAWNFCIRHILKAWNKFLNTQESWPTKDNCMW